MRTASTQLPRITHRCTIVALHGFNSNGVEFREKLRDALPKWWCDYAQILFVNAPMRRITCYRGAWMRSWHDYYTNFGDDGADREEEICVEDLVNIRESLRAFVDDIDKPVILLGESQGGCVALDLSLIHI